MTLVRDIDHWLIAMHPDKGCADGGPSCLECTLERCHYDDPPKSVRNYPSSAPVVYQSGSVVEVKGGYMVIGTDFAVFGKTILQAQDEYAYSLAWHEAIMARPAEALE
jgi:hypothetical protein